MRTVFFATLLAAGLATAGMSNVNAAPASGAAIGQAAEQLDSTLVVRNGCGHGRHWSWRWRRCVWN
jgi:hypothetical protein